MLPGQQVIEDYRHLHLSLKAHPVSFLRADFDARGIVRHELLVDIRAGPPVTIGGLVLVRQRPGNGNAIFMTLEDETGIANTIVWPRKFEHYRPVVMGARLISVTGRAAEREGRHPHRRRPFRGSDAALGPPVGARHRIDATAPADEVKRSRLWPSAPDAIRARAIRSCTDARRQAGPAMDELAAARSTPPQVMPKGRNFH